MKNKIILITAWVLLLAVAFYFYHNKADTIVSNEDPVCITVLSKGTVVNVHEDQDHNVQGSLAIEGQKEITQFAIASTSIHKAKIKNGASFKACYIIE